MADSSITLDISILQGIFGDITRLQQQLAGVAGSAGALEGSVDGAMRNMMADIMGPTQRAQELNDKLRTLGQQMNTAKSVKEVSALKKEIAATQRELDGVNPSRMEGRVASSAGRMRSLFGGLAGPMAGVFAIGGITTFIGGMARAAGAQQVFQSSLNNLLGSKQEADKMFAAAREFANTTPFDLKQVQQATQQLNAYGFSSEQIIPTMRMVGNVASAVGADFGQVAYAYGTARTQGTVYTRDLMQLTNAGIPIMDQLAAVMGVNATQVKELAEKGQIGFAQLEQAMNRLGGPTGKWRNQLDDAAKTITGRLSNLGGDFQTFVADLGLALAPAIDGAIELMTGALGKMRSALSWVIEHGQTIKDVLAGLTIATTAYGAILLWNNRALIQNNALKAIASVRDGAMALWTGLTTTAVAGATTAQWSWNAALLANPIGIVIAAIAAMVAGVLYCWGRFEGFRAFLYGFWETVKVVFQGVADRLSPLIGMVAGFGKTLIGAFTLDAAMVMDGIKQGAKAVDEMRAAWSKPLMVEAAVAYAKGDAEGRAAFRADAAKEAEGKQGAVSAQDVVPEPTDNVGASSLLGGHDSAKTKGVEVGGSAGSGRAITMTITMNNRFAIPKDGNMGAREAADRIVGALVNKLNDAQFAMG